MQHVRAQEFPSRGLRKRTPEDDKVAFQDKCNKLRLRAEEQEALHPVSFAIGNSWNDALRSDKQHYLEYTARSMDVAITPSLLFSPSSILPALVSPCFVPRAIFPWVPIDVLPSPALWLCGSLLHAPFQIHLLSGTPWWLCFPRPLGSFLFGFLLESFCVCLRCLFFFACLFAFALYVSSLWPLCASPFALGLSVVAACGICGRLPPSVVSVWRPGPVIFLFYWSLPLGIWLLLATAWLPCLIAWSVVVLCFLASFCSTAAKAFGPVWGI